MISRALVGAAVAAALVVPSTAAAGPLAVSGLTANRQAAPLGLGDARPALGWKLSGDGRGRAQSAYQVIVERGGTPVWDSGEVHSSASANVPYGGPALDSATRYTWKVRAWDETNTPTAYSAPATLETGLLQQSDWTAKWIAAPADDLNLSGARWIWFTNDDAVNNMPAMTRYLRATVTLPEAPSEARLLFTVDDEAVIYVNGTQVIDTKAQRDADENAWQKAQRVDIASLLKQGANTIAVQVKNRLNPSGAGTPGGFIARLQAGVTTFDTSSAWKSSTTAPDGWQQPGFDDSAWTPARELATYGSGPWGSNVSLPPQPSPYLRKDFTTSQPIAEARLYVTALGLYEVRINGSKVGDDVLAPGWTEYTKRVPSQTYDVTNLLRTGQNAIGAVLGEGWYAGRLQGGRKWGTNPALRAQLKITYADGTITRVSTDNSWQAGRGGVRSTSIYDGETYDARLDQPGWDEPGFGGWPSAVERTETMAVEPAQAPPIKVVDTLAPVKLTQPKPGTYVFDLGQNFAGWARLRVTGPAGTTVTLRYGELVNDDGTLVHDQPALRAADGHLHAARHRRRRDLRAALHLPRLPLRRGHRLPRHADARQHRRPRGQLRPARVRHVHELNPLVNSIQSAIRWGQRSNFLAVPSDASQRDERLGWTGDIQAFASTAAFNGDASGYLGQWLQTLSDSQTAAGAFPDVAPITCCGDGTAGWGDAGTVVPWALYRRYGDTRVLQRQLRRDEALDRLPAGQLDQPDPPQPGLRRLAGARFDPAGPDRHGVLRPLDRHRARSGARARPRRGRRDLRVAVRPDQVGVREPLGARRRHGRLRQPDELRARAEVRARPGRAPKPTFGRLVDDVQARGNHLSTGFLGTPFLLNVLQDGGRADVAYKLLTQDTYPSWGYMLARGGTTIWERWDGIRPDGSLQDAGMNSFNHYGLGSIGDWLYDEVGGLAPAEPGYRKLRVQPATGAELSSASSAVKTSYGSAKTRLVARRRRAACASTSTCRSTRVRRCTCRSPTDSRRSRAASPPPSSRA